MSATVSSPAKIFLLGEHVVVYGKPALLAAVDKRVYVKVKSQKSKVKNNEKIFIKTSEDDILVKKAIEVFQKEYCVSSLSPIEIMINSKIPASVGLGSSAAVSSATLGALVSFFGKSWDLKKINKLSFAVEKYAHGNPSGADNTTCVFGNIVWYQKESSLSKSIRRLSINKLSIPKFLLINTGRAEETTKEMVLKVASFYSKNKKICQNIFQDQEMQTKKLLHSFKTGNISNMKKALYKGEKNLERIQVVGRLAKDFIGEIEEIGGVGKICGAGGIKKGSGMVLCYHKKLSKIHRIAKKHKLFCYSVKLGEEGVRIEK